MFTALMLLLMSALALLSIVLGVDGDGGSGVDRAEAAVVKAPPAADRGDGPRLPQSGSPTLTVRDGKRVALRNRPGGKTVTSLTDATEFDSPTVLSVRERRGNWVGVPTHLLANGELGWVKLDRGKLAIDSVGQKVVIDLSDMAAKLLRNGEVERRWQVGIGAPGSSTPTGRFSITDQIESGLNPVYGCCAIALSASQPNLPPGWAGGDRIAIHGTSLPLGTANSNGCIQSAAADLHAVIESAPLGTPVRIKP